MLLRSRLLVVDDEPDMRFLHHLTFEAYGFVCDEAASGEEALRLHAAGPRASMPWSVVVLDQRMVGLTGIEVAVALRDRGDRTPLILYSGFIDPLVERQAAALDVHAVNKADHERLVELVLHLSTTDLDRSAHPG